MALERISLTLCSAQLTISPLCGANAQAHRWWRAGARRDRQSWGLPQSRSCLWRQSRCTALREKAVDGVSVERSAAPCTAAELSMVRGLCHSKRVRAPDRQLSPGRAPVPTFSLRRAPVPAPRKCPPEPAPPDRPPVSALVPEFSPGTC